MIDLWGDEDDEPKVTPRKVEETLPVIQDSYDLAILIKDEIIKISSMKDLEIHEEFKALLGVKNVDSNVYAHGYEIPLRPINAFILRYLLKSYKISIIPSDVKLLTSHADKVPMPRVTLAETGKRLELTLPGIEPYKTLVSTIHAYPLKNGSYSAQFTKIVDLQTLVNSLDTCLPKPLISNQVKELTAAPIPGFNGTLESLKNISVGELNVVKANVRGYKASKSAKTVKDQLESFGISTLYDLMSWLPKRYIDKTEPQDLRDLIPDEKATVVGIVSHVSELSNKAVIFEITTGSGSVIPVTFWRQFWLKNKFPVGTEVLVTGKFVLWNKRPQLNGDSIESLKEASLLPIVPVYKQSETKGITTTFLLTAVRELFMRLTEITLPEYMTLDNSKRMDYHEAYQELHLPSSLSHHRKVIDTLAYYELLYMQLLIQEAKEISDSRPGISMTESKRKLVNKAVKTLPFKLTNDQVSAVKTLITSMKDSIPSSTLLSADVGSGKTLVAQLAALHAVDNGFQSVIVGPTEVLAKQLFNTFSNIANNLSNVGENVNVAYLSGSLKAAEKKAIYKGLADGSIDILVGTHGVMSDKIIYKNLGFIAIDEQQKFGANQRSALLESRIDGRIPDILMQTATPIPRSTAQVFYGDIDMIVMTEKPPGRIPIETIWLQDDPNEIIEQVISPLWIDIDSEISKGNQVFVITPMVKENMKVDAASVERTFNTLRKTLHTANVGFVHGQMKQDVQAETMQAFRDKKYDVLVASTVVEVGVDIPDATRVIVLSADRLGASSLHQIRGRVGRNNKPSKCYLVSLGLTPNSQLRLQSLVDNDDGFNVAQADLSVRGEGQIFSTNQSGASEMVFASLSSHGKWVKQAKAEALQILNSEYREVALNDSRLYFSAEGRFM